MQYVLVGVLCILLFGCSRVEEPQTLLSDKKQVPNREIWNGKIEISNDAQLQSIVQAGHIESFDKQKITLLNEGVIVDFYDKAGRHTSVLTSQRAKVEERTDLFMAFGNVVVVSDSGTVLRTERLYWDRTGRKIHSDTLVILTTELDSLRGYDFEAKEDLTAWRLKNPTGLTFRRRQ